MAGKPTSNPIRLTFQTCILLLILCAMIIMVLYFSYLRDTSPPPSLVNTQSTPGKFKLTMENNLLVQSNFNYPPNTQSNANQNQQSSTSTTPFHTTRHSYHLTSNWHKCFRNHTYNNINHIRYIIDNIPMFTLTTSKREPTLNGPRCNLPIYPFIIGQAYYYMPLSNKIKSRHHCWSTVEQCGYGSSCEKYDMLNFLIMAYDIYKHNNNDNNNKVDWILLFEDDVLFCPSLFDFVYNVTYDFNKFCDMYGISDNKGNMIDSIELGSGTTGLLYRVDGIPNIIKLLQGIIDESSNIGSFDIVLRNKRPMNYYKTRQYLLWHPIVHAKDSLQHHSIKRERTCGYVASDLPITQFDVRTFPYTVWPPNNRSAAHVTRKKKQQVHHHHHHHHEHSSHNNINSSKDSEHELPSDGHHHDEHHQHQHEHQHQHHHGGYVHEVNITEIATRTDG